MRAAAIALFACACVSVQAQEVRLEYVETLGGGFAFVGPDEIAIDLVLDFPPPAAQPLYGGTLNILVDLPSLASTSGVDELIPPCPSVTNPCISQVTAQANGFEIAFEMPEGFNGTLRLATLRFNADNTGTVLFTVNESPANPLFTFGGTDYPDPVTFTEAQVEIVEGEAGVSGSLPELFDNTMGVPVNWSTFSTPPMLGPVWRSSAEPGACDFGNVTGGDSNAACLPPDAPTRGAGAITGASLCTDSPLDTSLATLPVLGLLANFQPNPGGAIFRVISGTTAPPNIAGYTTHFETSEAIGGFQALPGQTLTVPLPSEATLYICIVVDGDYAYAEVDECISCAVSYGQAPDDDNDGVADNVDNCLDRPNPDQLDTNSDGIGNACDADINNDCVVNFIDLNALKAAFFSMAGQANYNPDADFDGNDLINFGDLGLIKEQFFGPPGPSGQLNACNVDERSQRLRDCGIPD